VTERSSYNTAGANDRELGDFTMRWETLRLVPLALVIGVLSAVAALALLSLIAVITNLAYRLRFSAEFQPPTLAVLGAFTVVIPVIGGLIIGLMARYGSEQIRGHGIPEAMQTILVGGSKVKPRLTVLKPISSAIAIGTGGPFGAEGPIILTGGALGSVFAQFFKLSATERRSLLVAGAAAGMSAVFGTPIAAVVLGVELLVFEWRPRSLVLIALASAVAGAIRVGFAQAGLMDAAPLFSTNVEIAPGTMMFLGAVVIGIVGGFAAWLVTKAVYAAEDAFSRLPIHWMWWPALGGLVIGIGGLIEPTHRGVGYETIADELAGRLGVATLLSVFTVKLAIWAIGLGSGTSGGVLAPILIMGAAVGGLTAPFLPGGPLGAWALLGMAAVLAGGLRSPLTAVIFAFELTYDTHLLLPLLLASMLAYLVSVLLLKRSILTEKIARRGFHVLCEYSVDPLEALFAREVMSTDVVTVPPERSASSVYADLEKPTLARRQRLLPVLEGNRLVGAVPWNDILELAASGSLDSDETVADVMLTDLVGRLP